MIPNHRSRTVRGSTASVSLTYQKITDSDDSDGRASPQDVLVISHYSSDQVICVVSYNIYRSLSEWVPEIAE